MKNSSGTRAKLREWLKTERATKSRADLESWPFVVVVILVAIVLFGQAIYSRPALRAPQLLVPSLGLLLVILTLYLIVGLVPEDPRWRWGYLIFQSLLVVALTLINRDAAFIIGFFSPLIGLAVGIFRDRRQAAVAIVYFLVLAAGLTLYLLGLDGLLSWAVITVPVVFFVIVYVELYTRQAEAREKAQSLLEDLQEAHLQLAAYATQVEDLTLAAERQRMARELHDTLAQGLAGLILQLEALNSHLETGDAARAREIVQQAMGRARSTLAEARAAIIDLREVVPGDEKLELVLLQEVERFTRATGIPCTPEIALPETVPETLAEHVQRIIAESLANVAQHAQADQVWLQVAAEAADLQLTVRDDGVGFAIDRDEQAGHYGLVGMRERARLAGGTMKVLSVPGEGTTLQFEFPLADPEDR